MLPMFHFYFRNEKKKHSASELFLIVFSYFVFSAPSAELTLLIQQLDFKTRLCLCFCVRVHLELLFHTP